MTISHSRAHVESSPESLRLQQDMSCDQDQGHNSSSMSQENNTNSSSVSGVCMSSTIPEGTVSASQADGTDEQTQQLAQAPNSRLPTSDEGASSVASASGIAPSASRKQLQSPPAKSLSMLGAMLFKRGVSGTRVVAQGKIQSIAGLAFQGYGAHHDAYPHTYLTFAAALGTSEQDVDEFLRRLRLCLEGFRRSL